MRAVIGCTLALVILSSAACHTMKAVPLDQGLASDRMWVTLNDQSVVIISGPQIYGDKLVGFVAGNYEEYPKANVKQVQVRQTNKAGTAALIATGMGAFAAFAVMLSGANDTPADPNYCDLPEHVDELPCQE